MTKVTAANWIYDDAWGFEGHVPGPLLRVRVGDLVEVHLRNALNSHRTHNIDFHFVMGPGGGASALSVAPGEDAVLEARATAPGFYMFHCATPDIPMHIANGMYGFGLVEPEEGLPAVGKELGPSVHGDDERGACWKHVVFAADFTPESLTAAFYAVSFAEENDA